MMASAAELAAARVTGVLWAAIQAAGGIRAAARESRHFAGAYDGGWLSGLPVPSGPVPSGQPVALLDERDEFDRYTDQSALDAAYARQPRTKVYEDINRYRDGCWSALAARHLGRLSGCDMQVICSVFESRHGDQSLGGHFDTWYGAIVQLAGAKKWHVGPSVLVPGAPPGPPVLTRAGDILLLPKGLPHTTATPREPGHSVHLTFAIDRDHPNHAGTEPAPSR
jgi:hypothetical protein